MRASSIEPLTLDGYPADTICVIDGFEQASAAECASLVEVLLRGGIARAILLTRNASALTTLRPELQLPTRFIGPADLDFTEAELAALAADHPHTVDTAAVHWASSGHPFLSRTLLVAGADPARTSEIWAPHLLESLPDAQSRRAALEASLCPAVDVDVLTDLASTDSPAQLIADLVQAGLGTISGGDFQFVPAFARSLAAHALRELDPERARHIRECAIAHFREHARHALAVFELLVDLEAWAELWPHFANRIAPQFAEHPAADAVIARVPRAVDGADGTVTAIRTVLASTNDRSVPPHRVTEVRAALAEIAARPESQTPEERALRALAEFALVWSIRDWDGIAASIAHVQAASSTLDAATHARHDTALRWANIYSAIALTLLARINDSGRALDAIGSPLPEAETNGMAIMRAFNQAMRGEVSAARLVLENEVDDAPVSGPWSVRYTIAQAAVAIESGDPLGSRALLHQLAPALDTALEWPYAVIVYSRTHIATDPIAGIEDVDRVLREYRGRPISPGVQDLLHSAVGDLALAAGDVPRAKRLVAPRGEDDVALILTAARISLITGEAHAIDELRRLADRDDVWPRLRAQTFLLLSVHLYRHGDTDGAQHALRRALAITGPQQIRLIHSLTPHSELTAIAALAGVELPGNVHGSNPLEQPLTPVSLTARELHLLQRLTTPALLREIAASEFVAITTIKSQAASLYRKLGVNSRSEAVSAARKRGLIGD